MFYFKHAPSFCFVLNYPVGYCHIQRWWDGSVFYVVHSLVVISLV